MEPLFPFSKKMEETIEKKIVQARKEQERIEEAKREQREQDRVSFLNKQGKVIGKYEYDENDSLIDSRK